MEGVAVAEVEDVGARHGEAMGVEEEDSGVDEGKKQEPLERGDEVNADLGGDVVEAERLGQEDHHDGRGPDEGVDADDGGDGEGPGQTARGDAVFDEAQERAEDAAAEEVASALADDGMHALVRVWGRDFGGLGG